VINSVSRSSRTRFVESNEGAVSPWAKRNCCTTGHVSIDQG
jgi:hypothetical protein